MGLKLLIARRAAAIMPRDAEFLTLPGITLGGEGGVVMPPPLLPTSSQPAAPLTVLLLLGSANAPPRLDAAREPSKLPSLLAGMVDRTV